MITFLRNAWDGFQFARELRSTTLKAPDSWLLQALNGGPTKSGASVNENTAFNVSVVRACVNFRASLMAMLPVKVFQKTASGPEEQRDHALAKLLRGRVSEKHTRYKFMHTSQVCLDIGGNAYARVYRNRFAELERIRWVKPSDVEPLENKQTGEIAFRVQDMGQFPRWEILHIANLSTNGFTGRSPLADLRESVGLSLVAEEYAARSFANGNRKPGILVGGAAMNKERAEAFQEFWMRHYAGAANAGKSPFIWGGVEWKDAGFSNHDAELLGMRKFSVEEIARVYQIPLHLVGSTEKATTWGSGIEQLNQGLVDYMLGPLCANWEAEMNTTLLTEEEQADNFYVKFNVDALLRGSPKTRAEVYQIMRGIAAMDVNEIRAKEELKLYPDAWAGDPRQPMNNQGGGGTEPASKEPAANTDEE